MTAVNASKYEITWTPQLLDRFWMKIDRPSPEVCWEWMGSRKASGYGQVSLPSHKHLAVHRVAYAIVNGPIDPTLDLDHLCRNRACCNPAHLEPVTRRENLRRGVGHGSQTHCPQGHEYSVENTYVYAHDGRRCKTCVRARVRRYKERRRRELREASE